MFQYLAVTQNGELQKAAKGHQVSDLAEGPDVPFEVGLFISLEPEPVKRSDDQMENRVSIGYFSNPTFFNRALNRGSSRRESKKGSTFI